MEMNNTGIENIGRPIVNANIGVTNVLESNDIYSVMLDTFMDIVRILSDHCGPYGKFAMITSATNRIAEPVFTKDGIGIIRSLEYMSVMQEYVRNTLAYMGSRIETAAGDGTTSSMIICAQGMLKLLEGIHHSKYAYSYTDLAREYKLFAKDVERILKDQCYTIDKLLNGIENEEDRKKIIYRAAYSQAYTSSHGNKELSHAVATLFAETPKEAWDCMYIEKAKYESDKQFEVVIDDSQYTCNNVRIIPSNSLTDNMGTARIRNYARIHLCGIPPCIDDTFIDGHEVYTQIATAIGSTDMELEDAFICSKDIDSNTLNRLNFLFSKNPNTKTVLFLVDTADPRLNDIVCMKVLRNDMQLISGFYGGYSYEGSDLKITSGLIDNPDNSKINPAIRDKEHFPLLNEMFDNIGKVINQIKSQTANRVLNEQLNNLQKLRLKLLVSKKTYFRIGGSAYDVAAATDVVLDAILAVKHSLTNGFGLGCNKSLFTAVNNHWFTYKFNNDVIKNLHLIFIDAISDAIIQVFNSTFKWVNEESRPSFEQGVSQNIIGCEYIPEKERFTTIDELTKNLDKDKFIVPIIQPISADIEIINRFGEVALKFIETERIITPGGLVSNKKIDTI